ncbi:unnamed protein product, partial [Phaeothamnion confervicola]
SVAAVPPVELVRSRTRTVAPPATPPEKRAEPAVEQAAPSSPGTTEKTTAAPARQPRPQPVNAKQSQPLPDPPMPPAVQPPPAAPADAPPKTWTEAEIIDALKECTGMLGPISAEVQAATAMKDGQCGAPAPMMLRSIAAASDRIEFRPPVPLNCKMIVALHKWVETVVQPTARQILGSPVTRISSGTYSCRTRYNDPHLAISEHAFANAIDIMSFVTADGRQVEVVKQWGPTARDAAAM